MPRAPFTFLLLGLGVLPTRAEPQAPPVIASVTLNPSRVTGGATVTGLVTLSGDAGDGGVGVRLESSKTAIATVPQSRVVVQPGTRTATFVVHTTPVAGTPNAVTDPPFAEITAQRWTAPAGPANPARPIPPPMTVRLVVLPPSLASLTLSPSSVAGGTAATAQVQLTGPASAGGFTVALTSKLTGGDPASRIDSRVIKQSPVVSVPAQVLIPAGASSTKFQVTTRKVTAATPAQVTAASGPFNTKSATLTITP